MGLRVQPFSPGISTLPTGLIFGATRKNRRRRGTGMKRRRGKKIYGSISKTVGSGRKRRQTGGGKRRRKRRRR